MAARTALEVSQDRKGKRHTTSPIEGEHAQVNQLLKYLEDLGNVDSKLSQFSQWAASLPRDVKLLIFTEYLGTQSALREQLESMFGIGSVGLIQGQMGLDARRSVVNAFNSSHEPRILISTEAGGEGLNMQRACHIVVNYDLPWNPIRLQQRIGRVYRYGQQKPVQVYNFLFSGEGDAFIDGRVWEVLEQKVDEITQRFAEVQGANTEDVRTEVLGTLVSEVAIDQLYEEALKRGEKAARDAIERGGKSVEALLQNAKGMLGIFQGLKRFNLTEYENIAAQVKVEQLEFFVRNYLMNQRERVTHGEEGLITFRVPPALAEQARQLINSDQTEAREPLSTHIECATVDKEKAGRIDGARFLCFGELAFDAMIRHVQSADFSAGVASLKLPAKSLGWNPKQEGTCSIFDLRVLRKEGNSSTVVRHDLVAFLTVSGGDPVRNEDMIGSMIEASAGPIKNIDAQEVDRAYKASRTLADARLKEMLDQVKRDYGGGTEVMPDEVNDFALAWVVAV